PRDLEAHGHPPAREGEHQHVRPVRILGEERRQGPTGREAISKSHLQRSPIRLEPAGAAVHCAPRLPLAGLAGRVPRAHVREWHPVEAWRARAMGGAIAIAVHGGCAFPEHEAAPRREGCLAALASGWLALQAGGSALDAVERAVMALEDDPLFDAGTNAFLNADGQVELDACIMEGSQLQAGAVAAVQGVRNPVRLARRGLERPSRL